VSNDLEVTVEPLKISVSIRKAQSDGNYGSDEVFASVQQSIPDNATYEQVTTAVANLAAPLKEAVLAALPEPTAPKAQNKPSGGQSSNSGGATKFVRWHPGQNKYVPEENVPAWVKVAAAEQAAGAKEVVHAEKRDGSGDYWQARFADGEKLYLNEPEQSSLPNQDPTDEPF
jgi:hypothetical protein